MNTIRKGRQDGKDGFTVLEMALATVTLMVGIMSISAATLRMHHLSRQNRERTLAHNAVHAVAERINSASAIAAMSPSSWTDTVLNAYGPGGTVGNTFDVMGLTSSDEEGQVGSIVIITDETKTDAELGVTMGMPRDLNGDGDANDTDVTADARMLAVVITASWRGETSTVVLNHPLYVMGY